MSEAKLNLTYREKRELFEREALMVQGMPYQRRYIKRWHKSKAVSPSRAAIV
jgi:hypothetical protein